MLSLFFVYVYAVQEALSVADLAVTSVCTFVCSWHVGGVFFGPMPPRVLVDFVVLPAGQGRSVTDF